MLYCCFVELDALLSIIFIIIYGLFSLRSINVYLTDVFLFCRLFPLLFVLGFYIDSCSYNNIIGEVKNSVFHFPEGIILSLMNFVPTIDFLLAVLLFLIMYNFGSFESILLLLFTFIGQYYMLHSIDLLTFYIALEAQNFCFLVLCGLPTVSNSKQDFKFPARKNSNENLNNSFSTSRGATHAQGAWSRNYVFSVEASIKYFILSAFSSGVLLFWFSGIYLQTGTSILSFSPKEQSLFLFDHNDSLGNNNLSIFLVLCAMMFKLGAAPLHLWVVQIYNGVKRNLLLYISTAPKLSLFGFWVNSFQTVWTDYSILFFSIFSIILGAFSAYSQPLLRNVLAYSTINEIGLLLSALETAGFNSLFQHLAIYIISQILLWNLNDKRLFTLLAVSLAGLPPLSGFFGKVIIFWQLGNVQTHLLLLIALFCTAISLLYYVRIVRLFWNSTNTFKFHNKYSSCIILDKNYLINNQQRVYLTSTCVILLIILPVFVIKPFIL